MPKMQLTVTVMVDPVDALSIRVNDPVLVTLFPDTTPVQVEGVIEKGRHA